MINLLWELRSASEQPAAAADGVDPDGAATPAVAATKLAIGLVLLIAGSQLLVKGSIAAAQAMGVSQTVIGLTIVAAGTSMPELITSLVAAYRGKADIAIANVVGSNLLNQLVILGLCGVVSGGRGLGVDPVMLARDFPIMVATTLVCLPIFWSRGVISRLEGALLMGLYLLYLVDQLLGYTAPSMADEFRLVVLVVVLPVALIAVAWGALRWYRQQQQE